MKYAPRVIDDRRDPCHDLNLEDGRFGAPECSTVGAIIDGLRLACQNDGERCQCPGARNPGQLAGR